jgi:hypothetical protein
VSVRFSFQGPSGRCLPLGGRYSRRTSSERQPEFQLIFRRRSGSVSSPLPGRATKGDGSVLWADSFRFAAKLGSNVLTWLCNADFARRGTCGYFGENVLIERASPVGRLLSASQLLTAGGYLELGFEDVKHSANCPSAARPSSADNRGISPRKSGYFVGSETAVRMSEYQRPAGSRTNVSSTPETRRHR